MKGKIDSKKLSINKIDDNQPRPVKTARVRQAVWDAADELAKELHDCGVSSLIEPLIVSYFGLDTKTPSPEWKKRFPLLFPKSAQT